MVEGIVLAGGLSSRANDNKMLLPHKNKPIIEHVIDTMAPYVSTVFVVTGHYHDALTKALRGKPNVTLIYNANYMNGMFSSVQTGVAFTMGNFFVIPGDIPLIEGSTYKNILEASGQIRVPTYRGRKGHPLYIDKSLKQALLDEPPDSNLKAFRDKYPITCVNVDDKGIRVDVDTMADYHALNDQDEGTDTSEH